MFKKYFKYLWAYNKRLRQKYIFDVAVMLKGSVNRFLDLGCDDGSFTMQIGAVCHPKEVYGIEIKGPRAALAEQKGMQVKNSDLNEKFPFESSNFDLIISDQVIEHLVNLDNFVSEIKRVLKPGGYTVICTENLASPHNIFALMLGMQPFTGPNLSSKYQVGYRPLGLKHGEKNIYDTPLDEIEDHKKVMTYKALLALFKAHGLEIISGEGFGYLPFPGLMGKILGKLDKNHSQFIAVLARKPT
ncbi:hypothetical protein A2886_00925 [candidate division WWE3 bacterium RIFCSPHIGHO2_01_FULL_42_13]|uniref:Methyltransferase type 11 domain-containing protein n=1 Tax=candidate division WWE3 bacterium RIFCSPHIGHO2_01_FULL_42_13 TaxID=1802617 RepID=A0A1F4UQG9_UNCKA|nr:MAG: hypothetical protein A2886_00925 [candidate division WWE3 bacterium RIFCSPHIGHO2_01_FULL_42_13]